MKLTKNYAIENELLKTGMNVKLQEAFSAGSASNVVFKLGHIINNRLGTRFEFAEIPLEYTNSYGSFAGFLGNDDSSGLMIKINFLLSGSDSIESFDIYLNGFSDAPSYTVDTNGFNIIQVVDCIAENLVEDGEVSEEVLIENFIDEEGKNKLLERGAITSDTEGVRVIGLWVKEDRNILKDLQKMNVPDIFNELWQPWVENSPAYQCAYYVFAKGLKMYLLQNGLLNKTLRPRKKGIKERQIEDPVLSAKFDDVIDNISWEDKYNFFRGAIQQMIKGNLNSIIVVGSPGSGKTFTTLEELDKANVEYVRYSGGAKRVEDLVRILYNRRDGQIIVFDDFDSIWANKPAANILKAALDNKAEREITYVDTKPGKNMSDIEPKFFFDSYIIFISNSTKIDPAIASRSVVVDLSMGNSEVIEKIEKTLKEYRPEVDIKIKQEALDYLREISPGVLSVDYRVMDNIIVAMQISPRDWRKMSLFMIKNFT